jgi:hypothetical protein
MPGHDESNSPLVPAKAGTQDASLMKIGFPLGRE